MRGESGHNGGRFRCLGRAFWATAHISAELVELVPELNSTRDLQSIDVPDHGVLKGFSLAFDQTQGPWFP